MIFLSKTSLINLSLFLSCFSLLLSPSFLCFSFSFLFSLPSLSSVSCLLCFSFSSSFPSLAYILFSPPLSNRSPLCPLFSSYLSLFVISMFSYPRYSPFFFTTLSFTFSFFPLFLLSLFFFRQFLSSVIH